MTEQTFMQRAVALSLEKMRANSGGPFGAVIVRNGTIISEGWNEVTSRNDPTAHSEIVAIRRACTVLGTFNLLDCDIYTSCEPCPMCLGAAGTQKDPAFPTDDGGRSGSVQGVGRKSGQNSVLMNVCTALQ
jgi:tRNA(Arg) A34 adenosine deaminase TadA